MTKQLFNVIGMPKDGSQHFITNLFDDSEESLKFVELMKQEAQDYFWSCMNIGVDESAAQALASYRDFMNDDF